MGVYIMPQAVLYAKSGFNERYLIPGVMGFAFLTIYLLAKTAQLITLKALRFGIDAILVIITLPTLAADFGVARSGAKAFAAEGASLKRALDTLASNTKSSDAILIVADPALDFGDFIVYLSS